VVADIPEDSLAIVGMAGRFPDADDLDAFWANLRDGRECVHFYSDTELASLGMDPCELRAHGHVAATPRIAKPEFFDAGFFGYTAEQAAVIDPQQRIFLEVCWEAAENAGRDPRSIKERVGIFGGQGISNYMLFNLASAGQLRAEHYFSTVVSNGPDFLCSRVAYVCGLTGPCVTVQTACSTGIVALHQACQSLLNFECDVALAGAATLQLLPLPGHFYDGGKSIYSSDGHSRIFDASATGTTFGDGVAVVVLRRLEDAVEDGDSIRATVRGSAINNSGTVAAGFSTPSVKAQEDVAAEAINTATISAESIGYLEMHGSGSVIGDAIEVSALSRAFRRTMSAGGLCGLGAVKSNVGHLGAAAGMASLCKTVLALEHNEIPPTILVDQVNPSLGLDESPFHLVLQTEAFPDGRPRRAAVNSYGIGGTNAHVILEEAPAVAPRQATDGPYILLLSARTADALDDMSTRLAAHLAAHPTVQMADVAWTLATGRTEFLYRRVCVCRDLADAVTQLSDAGHGEAREASNPSAILVLDPAAHVAGPAGEALVQRWFDWGVDVDGVFAWGASDTLASTIGEARGVRTLAESTQGVEGLNRLRSRVDVTLIDGYCQSSAALAPLAQLWAKGASLDWPVVLGSGHRRVPLPSYPFQRQRHWVDLPSSSTPVAPSPVLAPAAPSHEPADRPALIVPRSELESVLCQLWSEVVGDGEFGIDDNFFALGGSSLQLAEVHARLRSQVLDSLTVVDVFMNPTVRALAAQIERVRITPSLAGTQMPQVGGLSPSLAGQLPVAVMDQLKADAQLSDDIRPTRSFAPTTPEHVLLTGATGFLGVYLLHELLEQTQATVYCHVRAETEADGLNRIRTAMAGRELWDEAFAGRIIPVRGDLGNARLGVSEADYGSLANRIDAIIHNGASVNFTPPYESLKKINVTGTEDILRFACDGRIKALHFVSSTGVWGGRFPVEEDDPLDEIAGLENGYTQSKWVAERLVQAAGDRGLSVTIHRPPRVSGDTRTGSTNLDDFVARAIKGCAELGAAPAGHFFDILAPVDFVARAIVAIARSPEAFQRRRFHIVPRTLMSWRTILDFMPQMGLPLDVIAYPQWRERLLAHCQNHDNALKTLLPLFRPSEEGGFAAIPEDADLALLPGVPCQNATSILEAVGIECPAIDTALLETYFGYFFDTGFIVRPGDDGGVDGPNLDQ
jgi:phthiocerol/phenolphthiocerol synthesis type-I polyketide synthase E